jgi:hypothetical protein
MMDAFSGLPDIPDRKIKVSRAPMDADGEMCASRLLAFFFFRKGWIPVSVLSIAPGANEV